MIDVQYMSDDNKYLINGDLSCTAEEARHLIRSLIDAGVSMTLPDTSYGAGELAATKQHLEDLRKIVFEEKQ